MQARPPSSGSNLSGVGEIQYHQGLHSHSTHRGRGKVKGIRVKLQRQQLKLDRTCGQGYQTMAELRKTSLGAGVVRKSVSD